MQKTRSLRLDWLSIFLVTALFQVAVTRLIVTRWTDFLIFSQSLTTIGAVLGLALGYSQFEKKWVKWLAIGYSLVLVPWQLTLAIKGDVLLSEKLISVGGRLLFSLGQFFRHEIVDDGLLFVTFISIVTWSISLISGYFWTRHQNYLVTVLPAGIFTIVIQLYDSYNNSRIVLVGMYMLLALILLGRVHYLSNRDSWRARRVFQMQESSYDLTRGVVITATIFVLVAWTIPASAAGWQAAVQTWSRLTKPWREFQELFSNAVDILESQGGRGSGDIYGNQLDLGLGNPLADTVLFTVKVPALGKSPPRYYWRGFIYDYNNNDQWKNSFPVNEDFEPSDEFLLITDSAGRTAARFTITTQIKQSLLYTPTQPSWVSRPGQIRTMNNERGERDIAAWFADPSLSPGERFEVEAVLADPSIQDLQAAGSDYPAWVLNEYLQLPEDFSPRIIALAEEITLGIETPYEKAVAITNYLRREIAYANPLPEPPPENVNGLEWMLFDSKVGFCNYYATAEVLMLRSIGIPARMAVGFAEGEFDHQEAIYTVRSLDAHAWPEVYFPGIGWIEFEPTGNQAALLRPNRPEPDSANGSSRPNEGLLESGALISNSDNARGDIEAAEFIPQDTVQPYGVNPVTYIGATALLLVLLWGLNRRYAVFGRVPFRLQTAFERNGGQAPAWVLNWARWNQLTPIERAYETINRSLRLLGETPALHDTPAKRLILLTKRLPEASRPIKTLTAQHQASLFSPQPGLLRLAQRASLAIWGYTLRTLLKEFIKSLDERFSSGQFG
jgi:transglutaminase-like putative cysteine protease